MRKTVEVDFPDDFKFPERVEKVCDSCIFHARNDAYHYCVLTEKTCPFRKNDKLRVVLNILKTNN